MAYSLVGLTLWLTGRAEDALKYHDQAKRAFQDLVDENNNKAAARMVAVEIGRKGDYLRDLGRLDESVAAYEESLNRLIALEDQKATVAIKHQLVPVLIIQERYPEALATCNEILTILAAMEEPRSVITTWHNIGVIHRGTRQWDKAEDAYKQALALAVQQQNSSEEAGLLSELGLLGLLRI